MLQGIPKDAVIGVAMSGGVDSSVAAALLARDGYDVIGLTMHLWSDPKGGELALNRASGCCSITMTQDAAAVAERMGFRHYVLNLSEEFHGSVVKNFAHEYLRGRTPNPCVRCNTFVKWQTLLDRARRMGCDFLATGHYARVDRSGDRHRLYRSTHLEKDQSYALWGLSQESLSHTLFPLGEMPKPTVRALATELGLATADKPESQDICFVPDDDYRRFLGDNFAAELAVIEPGDIVGPGGEILGRHSGITNFTVGQRRGLGVAAGRRMYVRKIDADTQQVFLDDDEQCVGTQTILTDVNWVSVSAPQSAIDCSVKIRYRDTPHAARVSVIDERKVRVEFLEPVRAITPGQSAVFYDGDMVLGGGVIGNAE